MPFEAARAVTATFCYRIRYVLTPIFGLDFPAQCIPPGAPGYDSMQIAPKIIGNCMKPATNYYDVPREPQSGSRPETPLSAGVGCWTPANARSKVLRTFGSESGYGTDDTECSDMYLCSPKKPARSGFRHLATPGPAAVQRRYKTCYAPSSAPSPSSTAYGDESELSDDCKKRKRNPRKHADRDSESSSSDASESNVTTSAKKRKASSTPPVMTAESAAKCLVDLCLQDSCKLDTATFFALQKGVETRERRKRRASA